MRQFEVISNIYRIKWKLEYSTSLIILVNQMLGEDKPMYAVKVRPPGHIDDKILIMTTSHYMYMDVLTAKRNFELTWVIDVQFPRFLQHINVDDEIELIFPKTKN